MLNKIIYGKNGCRLKDEATRFTRQALCSGSGKSDCRCPSCMIPLSTHPDYKIFDRDKYFAEDVDEILSFANHPPVIGSCRAAVVLNLNGLSPALQNKLLKDIEDNDNFFMAATAPEGLGLILPTIQSRTEAVFVRPMSKMDFMKSIKDPDAEFLYYMTQSCPDNVDDMQMAKPIFKRVKSVLENGHYRQLYTVLKQVMEKDKENFFTVYKEFTDNLFFFMEQCLLSPYTAPGFLSPDAVSLSDTGVAAVIQVIENERTRYRQPNYGSNDFFLSVCHIVNSLETLKKEMD